MTSPAPLPSNEAERLAALRRYAILDTAPDACFDRLVHLGARLFHVPIAVVSLVDKERQWSKAACGIEAGQSDRDIAFCAHAILGDDVFLIPDATQDTRFANNPLVIDGLKIRFYAGAPLTNPQGLKLGTLCLIDTEPRHDFSAHNQALLTDLAAVVVDQIEMRYATSDVLDEVETRIRAEDDLATAEHQLRLFFRYAPVSVAMFDCEMRYLAASDLWRETLQIADKSIIGRRHSDVVPHLPSHWKAQYQRCLKGETLEVAEDKLPKPDGGFHWVWRQIRPWRDLNGAIGGLIVSVEIIDARKQAAAALEQGRAFTEAILQNIQDGIIACDADGRLSLFNEASRGFHGVGCEAIPPDQWADAYNLFEADGKTPLPTDKVPLFRALGGEIVENQSLVIASRDGACRTVVAHATPMYDAEGRKLGAVASVHDVTKERIAEERWREAHLLYRAIFNQTYQFCSLLDTEGTVLEANQTALDFAGVTREDVVGLPFWKCHWWCVGEATQKDLEHAVTHALAGEFVRYEVDIQGRGGVRTPIDFSLKPVANEDGTVKMLIAEGRDIGDKRASDEAFRRNQAELELILDNVPIRIFYKDDANRMLRLNAPAAKSMGMTVDEVEGRSAYDLFPEIAKKYHDDDLEVINSGEPKLGIIEEYVPRDGNRGWCAYRQGAVHGSRDRQSLHLRGRIRHHVREEGGIGATGERGTVSAALQQDAGHAAFDRPGRPPAECQRLLAGEARIQPRRGDRPKNNGILDPRTRRGKPSKRCCPNSSAPADARTSSIRP